MVFEDVPSTVRVQAMSLFAVNYLTPFMMADFDLWLAEYSRAGLLMSRTFAYIGECDILLRSTAREARDFDRLVNR